MGHYVSESLRPARIKPTPGESNEVIGIHQRVSPSSADLRDVVKRDFPAMQWNANCAPSRSIDWFDVHHRLAALGLIDPAIFLDSGGGGSGSQSRNGKMIEICPSSSYRPDAHPKY